jgi:predicted amidohydrolase YtcJ
MIDMASRTKQRRTLGLALTISLAACSGPDAQSADLVLIDGSLYSYAWRTMLELGVPLTFNSDNPGSSHDPFYGLHSAVTRRDPSAEARGGWYPEQAVTPEEAIRAYTSGAAYAAFLEEETGVLTPGRWADVTVLSIDPLRVATGDTPEDLFDRRVVMTIVSGVIAYEAPNTVNR